VPEPRAGKSARTREMSKPVGASVARSVVTDRTVGAPLRVPTPPAGAFRAAAGPEAVRLLLRRWPGRLGRPTRTTRTTRTLAYSEEENAASHGLSVAVGCTGMSGWRPRRRPFGATSGVSGCRGRLPRTSCPRHPADPADPAAHRRTLANSGRTTAAPRTVPAASDVRECPAEGGCADRRTPGAADQVDGAVRKTPRRCRARVASTAVVTAADRRVMSS